jgi:hypothetical protein
MQFIDQLSIAIRPHIAGDARDPKLNLLFQPQMAVGIEDPGGNEARQFAVKKLPVMRSGDTLGVGGSRHAASLLNNR